MAAIVLFGLISGVNQFDLLMAQVDQEVLLFFLTTSLGNLLNQDLVRMDIVQFFECKITIVTLSYENVYGYNNLSQNKLLISEISLILEE